MKGQTLGPSAKRLLGLATLWPLIWCLVAPILVITLVGNVGTLSMSNIPKPLLLILIPHVLTLLGVFALLIFYLVYLFRSERIDKEKKALWAVVLFMGNMVVMPIFFYLHVWRDPPAKSLPGQSPQTGLHD